MTRILVTGASGFVGAWLTRAIGDQAEVHAFPGDIRDADLVRRTISEQDWDAVIHLAAIASPGAAAREPDIAWAVNVLGTFNIADAIRRHAPQTRLIFAGSSEVYGKSLADSPEPVNEATLLQPLSSYGATKAAADIMLAQMASEGLDAVRFRPFNHTGPGQAPIYVFSAFARQIVRIEKGWQEPVLRTGNLDVWREFLDVRDVVRAYTVAALGKAPETRGEAINLATGKPVRIGDMLDHMIGASRAKISIETDPTLVRAGEIRMVTADVAKAERLLGWKPEIALTRTLEDVLDWWRGEAERFPEKLNP